MRWTPDDDNDRDGDGFVNWHDCNYEDSTIYPNAEEIVNDGIDQDCDGVDDVEVLGVYRDLLRVHDKLRQVSCIVIEDYKTVDCFEQHTLRTVMRRTREFEGQLKDIALLVAAHSLVVLFQIGVN